MVRRFLGVVALVLLAGCATNRAEVDVDVLPPGNTQTPAPSNGKKVFVSAVDERVFQVKPDSFDIPSLKHDEIDDKSITERAIARKRNNFNWAIGDVLLPKGRTVAGLVSDAVASAYRQAGYEVVSSPTGRDVRKVQAVTGGTASLCSSASTRFYASDVRLPKNISVIRSLLMVSPCRVRISNSLPSNGNDSNKVGFTRLTLERF